MMKKTRLGNDIAVTIALFTLNADGERKPYALGGNSLSLIASTALDTAQMQIVTVAGNIVEAILPGSAQRATGVYSLTLSEEHGESSRIVDICNAFEIVSCSCEVGGADIANNSTIECEAVIMIANPALIDNNSTMTLRGTYTATDVDSPVVWTTPYDELLRIAESMKRAEAGEDNNTLYYIVLDGPLGQLQAQLSYIKPWEMWMGEIPFTLAPANAHGLFIIHLSITLPEDDNTILQANCWVGRKQLPTMDRIATRFVDTEEQMLGPQGRLQARTNIGLPVHRLWMQLDRSEGVEGVFCTCKRAEGYDEENAATIAAMIAASNTATRDMFLITIFDGNTAVTGELNCIAAELWVAEIALSVGAETILRWTYTVNTEAVANGEIDGGRVVFSTAPSDIERAAVITGYRSLELTSTQIGTARGNLQIYTVICDSYGNLLTTASSTAVAKMSEVQQDLSKGLDSVFILKLVENNVFYTVAMTLKGGYWLGATPSTRFVPDGTPLMYLFVEATIADGTFNLTLIRHPVMTHSLFRTLLNGNIKANGIGEFMAATPSGSPQHELYTSVGANWNATTGYWEFKGINDMTNADMAKSLALANMISNPEVVLGQYALMTFRTNIWNKNIRSSVEVNLSEAFRGNSLLEVLDFRTNSESFKVKVKSIRYSFYGCHRLRKILGVLDVSNLSQITNAFYSPLLEEVYLFHAKADVDVSYSPVFKKVCLLYMIQNAVPSTAMTIKVHADVDAWASTDAEVQAALTAQPLVTLISA